MAVFEAPNRPGVGEGDRVKAATRAAWEEEANEARALDGARDVAGAAPRVVGTPNAARGVVPDSQVVDIIGHRRRGRRARGRREGDGRGRVSAAIDAIEPSSVGRTDFLQSRTSVRAVVVCARAGRSRDGAGATRERKRGKRAVDVPRMYTGGESVARR